MIPPVSASLPITYQYRRWMNWVCWSPVNTGVVPPESVAVAMFDTSAVPMAFTALTWKVYEAPLVSPVTVRDDPEPARVVQEPHAPVPVRCLY